MLQNVVFVNENPSLIAGCPTQLLQHTKTRLIDSEGYTDSSIARLSSVSPPSEVPERHPMQIALNKAVTKIGLENLQDDSIDNPFIVSEPEGAAACVLVREKTHLKGRSLPTTSGYQPSSMLLPHSCSIPEHTKGLSTYSSII